MLLIMRVNNPLSPTKTKAGTEPHKAWVDEWLASRFGIAWSLSCLDKNKQPNIFFKVIYPFQVIVRGS